MELKALPKNDSRPLGVPKRDPILGLRWGPVQLQCGGFSKLKS